MKCYNGWIRTCIDKYFQKYICVVVYKSVCYVRDKEFISELDEKVSECECGYFSGEITTEVLSSIWQFLILYLIISFQELVISREFEIYINLKYILFLKRFFLPFN